MTLLHPGYTIEYLRNERNYRLDCCDIKCCNSEKWGNMTSEKQAEWVVYKQALRDLPATADLEGVDTEEEFNALFPAMPT